jgi:hypothetical protein
MRLAVGEDAGPAAPETTPPAREWCGDCSDADMATNACDCCANAAGEGVGGGRPAETNASR